MALQAMFSPVGMSDNTFFYQHVYEAEPSSYYGLGYSGPWIYFARNYKFSFTSIQDDNLYAFFRIKMPASLKTNEFSFVNLLDNDGNAFAKLTLDTVGRISLQSADGSGFSTVPSSTYAPTKPGFSPKETVQIQIRCWHYSQAAAAIYLKLNDKSISPIVVRTTSKWKKIEFIPEKSTFGRNENEEDLMSFTDLLLCDGSGSDFNNFLPFVPQIEMANFSFVKAKPDKNISATNDTCGYSSSLRAIREDDVASFCFSSQTSSYLELSQFTVEVCITRVYSSKIPFTDNDWFLGWSTTPSSGGPPVGLSLVFQNDGADLALVERKVGTNKLTVHMSASMPPVPSYSRTVFSSWQHIALVYRNPVMLLYVDGDRIAREARLTFINDKSNATQLSNFCWMDYMGACRLTANVRYKGSSPKMDEIPFATGKDDPDWSDVLYLADFDKQLIFSDRGRTVRLPSIVPPGTYAEAKISDQRYIVQPTNRITPLTLDVYLKNYWQINSVRRGVVIIGDPSDYELTFQVKPRSFDGRGWKAIQSFVVADQDGKNPNKDKWYCTVDVNDGAYMNKPEIIFDKYNHSFVSPVAMSDSDYKISIKTSANG